MSRQSWQVSTALPCGPNEPLFPEEDSRLARLLPVRTHDVGRVARRASRHHGAVAGHGVLSAPLLHPREVPDLDLLRLQVKSGPEIRGLGPGRQARAEGRGVGPQRRRRTQGLSGRGAPEGDGGERRGRRRGGGDTLVHGLVERQGVHAGGARARLDRARRTRRAAADGRGRRRRGVDRDGRGPCQRGPIPPGRCRGSPRGWPSGWGGTPSTPTRCSTTAASPSGRCRC